MSLKPKIPNDRISNNNLRVTSQKHHYIRTILASIFGTLALVLIFLSILVVWLNRTLTDTSTYVSTVAPLVSKPAIQNFVAEKATQQLLTSASINDIAGTLLPAEEINGKSADQLQQLVKPIITANVLQIFRSQPFASLWADTNRSAHQQFIRQLNTNSSQITLDLSPLVNGIIEQLKTTRLSPVSAHLNLKPSNAMLNLKGSIVDKMHAGYTIFKRSSLIIAGATLLAVVLCIVFSVHHIKTARRILFGTGIITLVFALILEAPSYIPLSGNDPVQQAAIIAVAKTLLHNLQEACLILGILCLVTAVGSKIYSKLHNRAS